MTKIVNKVTGVFLVILNYFRRGLTVLVPRIGHKKGDANMVSLHNSHTSTFVKGQTIVVEAAVDRKHPDKCVGIYWEPTEDGNLKKSKQLVFFQQPPLADKSGQFTKVNVVRVSGSFPVVQVTGDWSPGWRPVLDSMSEREVEHIEELVEDPTERWNTACQALHTAYSALAEKEPSAVPTATEAQELAELAGQFSHAAERYAAATASLAVKLAKDEESEARKERKAAEAKLREEAEAEAKLKELLSKLPPEKVAALLNQNTGTAPVEAV